jgi:hypothetical protein
MKMTKSRSSITCWRRITIATPILFCVIAALGFTGISSAGGSMDQTAAEAPFHTLSGASGCAKGTAQGITTSTVRLAVTVVNISGGSLTDATVGIPTAQEQEKDWSLVANSINKAGGAGCRKLQLSFYDVNPIDAAGAQQTCLTIANSHPYMALDVGALSEVNASNCIPAAKVPFVSNTLTPDQLTRYYPYYLEVGGVPTDALRNGVLGLGQLGYFKPSKGFKKLGVLYDTCNPALITAERAALEQAGVPAAKTVYFNLGCPAGEVFSSAAVEQAVLSFKNSGVTDVTSVGGPTVIFTQQAALQDYKPIYALTNDVVGEETLTGSNAPNPTNLNGAIDIEASAYGEQTTPGFKPASGTKKCNAVFAAAHLPSVYNQSDAYGGVACNYLWYVQALLNHATTVEQSKLPSALHNVGTVNFSYPSSPVNFTAAPKSASYGTSLWRAEIFSASCKCWHIPNPTWNPPFK